MARSPAGLRALGWDLLDHELLHRAAQLERLPDPELEPLDEHAIGLADRFRLHPPHQRYILETDWSDPLEYDMTVNSGWLGPKAVDLVALAAERFWNRTDRV